MYVSNMKHSSCRTARLKRKEYTCIYRERDSRERVRERVEMTVVMTAKTVQSAPCMWEAHV